MKEHNKTGALTDFAVARDYPGYKWEMNYRSYNVYYSAKDDKTIAVPTIGLESMLEVDGADGSIFGEIDRVIEASE